jgi:hypothetical protein
MLNRTVGTGGLVMMLVVALAAIGIGIALWSKVLTINGIVRTGTVNAAFTRVFTDDDDAVDNPEKDSMDTGDCPISIGPETPPAPFLDKRTAPGTSCDPARTGRIQNRTMTRTWRAVTLSRCPTARTTNRSPVARRRCC